MIKANFSAYASYATDSLYQWDINRTLTVTGLNLSVVPEVHFSNASMDKAIVRQAVMKHNVIKVDIPNTLLQSPLPIKAHIGIYEGDTFKVVELVEIPVRFRTRPADYVFEDTEGEIYSYKALENKIANINDTWVNKNAEQVNQYVKAWLDDHPEATTTVQDGALTETKFSDDLKHHTVKDYVTPQMFGAKADGVTDDTEAVRAAINAIGESYYTTGVTTKTGTACTLLFPKGVYVISDTLDLGEIHSVDFSNAVIKSAIDNFIFASSAYNAKYIGGTFIGEKIFTFNNNNNDQGNILIERAEFKNCEIAIDVTCQSSQFIIEKCKFDTCMHPLVQNACDGMTFEKNWCTCPIPTDGESNFKLLGGKTTFKNNLLVPIVGKNDGIETAWIEHDQNILICTDNRFGGENGGRTPVNHRAKYTRENIIVLIFDNNMVSNQRDEAACIRLFSLPNTLLVRNNYYGVLTKYVLSVTSVETAAFNAVLDEVYALYTSAALEEDCFGYPKFRRFQYEIDNNFMQGRNSDDNAMEVQRENEMWFLLKNYSKVDRLNSDKCAFSPSASSYQTQKITNYGTEAAHIYRLPLFVSNGIELEVSFNPNYKGADYSVKKSYKVFPTKYYDNSKGAIVEKFAVVDLNGDIYPDDINAMVSIGKYNSNGDYFGDNAKGVTGRLAIKITGIAVKCDKITCKAMF